MKKTIRKVLSIVLAVAMLSGLSVCFASAKEYHDYGTYVLLGDSVASGHDDITYAPTEFIRVEGSYADLVADELGCELIPMACPGFRTIEMRYMLEDDYNEIDDYLFHDVQDAEVMKARIPQYRQNIADADLITLGVGGNDFGTLISWMIADIMEAEGLNPEFAQAVRELVAKAGVGDDIIDQIIDLANTMNALPELIEVIPQALVTGLTKFFTNWNYVIEDIYALNPDVTLLVIGMFDNSIKSEEDVIASEADQLKLNVGQMIVDMANTPMKEGAEKYGYTFVDTTGTICVTYHPTAEGHQHIANRILEALPDADFPYTDVALGSENYKAVEYMYKNNIMSGVSATEFGLDAAFTKAQFAEALYNIAGAPEVDTTVSFSDVNDADPKKAAMVWANENGLLTASADSFSPDSEISALTFAVTLFKATSATGTNFIQLFKVLFFALGMIFGNVSGMNNALTRADAAANLMDYCEL